MKRIEFPIVIQANIVGTFTATLEELVRKLGQPGLEEADGLRTFGGTEYCWAFELPNGQKFIIVFNLNANKAMIIADPPDPQPIVNALGLSATENEIQMFEPVSLLRCETNAARSSVWVFCSEGGYYPSAVFSTRHLAEVWIQQHKLSGLLIEYDLDIPPQVRVRWLEYKAQEAGVNTEPEFNQRYCSVEQEKHYYREGEETG